MRYHFSPMTTHRNIQSPPTVLLLAGNDPSGGAGLCADQEAVASQGCHPAPVVTALTVQDTHNVFRLEPIPAELVIAQARTILRDIPVRAVKIGLLGSAENARAIAGLLREHPDLPVVLDPILRAGGGATLLQEDARDALEDLLSTVTVLTPNGDEARALCAQASDLDACGRDLLHRGCEFVLITGGHEPEQDLVNRLYVEGRAMESFSWPRLPGTFHGTGCTLASAITGLLAQGREPRAAIHQAQDYTWQTLYGAYRLSDGQEIPNRLFWARRGR